ncbi:EthD family reductase [Microbacterium sp. dk485]|uniref:EthD family reductase n=1 Tax=Microbacterium sp. dk485 TaxID=2560021 RepID=UPI001072F058|nr:EthD family reductase [Microbacterium sp. dk485]TFV83872.1 EthD family reductase [Microbacterium sp. dk485]
MHKLVVLYPQPPDPAGFESYYRSTHLPLASRMPGMLDHRFSTAISAQGGASPYFAVYEADFPDRATMAAALSSPEGRAVAADVPNYAPEGTLVLDYETETPPE